MRGLFLITALFLTGCGSTTTFIPKSGYPPDHWVKSYTDPDDCIGGEQLAPVKFDLPDYPKSAFRNGRQGWAIVRLDVDSAGNTHNVRIERSVPEGPFDKTSREAVEAWQFRSPKTPLFDCRVLLSYRAGAVSLGGN